MALPMDTSLIKLRSACSIRVLALPFITYFPVRAGMPWALASSAVMPMQAISGSVYTQEGTTLGLMAGVLPAIPSTQAKAWASAAWASCILPLQSPTP